MPVEVQQERARRGSKRIRRVIWTASAIAVVLAICGVVTWRIHKDNQPGEYVPGEESKDITNVAADRGAQKAAPVPQPVKKDVSSRTADRLLDPGRKLPGGAPEPPFGKWMRTGPVRPSLA